MDRPRPELKYLPVEQLHGSKMTFDNFTVEDRAGEHLGMLEGFVIDVDSGQPYYVVVNAAGWFRSKHVLIPVGHVGLDYESHVLIADVPKQRIKRFPGFDLDTLPHLTRDDLDRMAEDIQRVCCPDHVIEPAELLASQLEGWAHYRTPAWWNRDVYQPERYDGQAKLLTGKER